MVGIGILAGRLSIIIAATTVVIAGIYAWLLPVMFPQLRTYLFLAVGLGVAAVLGAYYTFRTTGAVEAVAMRWLLALGGGVLTALVVLLLSLLIILNTRGS